MTNKPRKKVVKCDACDWRESEIGYPSACPAHLVSQKKEPSPSQEEWERILRRNFHNDLSGASLDDVVDVVDTILGIATSQARASTLKEVGEAIEEVSGEIYPEDIFPPPPKGWEKKLDKWCKSQGYRIDNVSGWYARWARANVKRDLLALLQEKGDSKGGV